MKTYYILEKLEYQDLCDILNETKIYHHSCATKDRLIYLIITNLSNATNS